MSSLSGSRLAPGGPGIEPRWTCGAKAAVGTAYSTSSHVWYTLDYGCVTEVYYPTIDSPQIRDLQFLITDGESFFHDERRSVVGEVDCVSEAALGFEVTNREKQGRYIIHNTILGDPHQNCLLIHTRLEAHAALLPKLRMYVLCAPHLEIGGWHNNGEVLRLKGHTVLAAYKGNTWLVIGATVPFTDCSCGYVGVNDGWTDLADNYRLHWQYEAALDGNIALTGGLDLSRTNEFTLGVAFGTSRHDALSSLAQSLSIPFEQTRESFIHQWDRTSKRFALAAGSNNSKLFERSVNLLLAHEDKTYPGAMIASLSIPWGDEKNDDELGGYHLVWTRDMVKCVSALLAVGDFSTPLRALIYLAVSQREDVRTGKHLPRQLTEVRVHFKRTPQALFSRTPDEQVEPNIVVIGIQPDEGIVLQFGAKKPGGQMQVVPVQANFSYRTAFSGDTPVAYQTLLLDAMRGDQTLFTRGDEIEAEWGIITPIEEAWAQLPVPDFPNYAAGSEGPQAADELVSEELRGWHAIIPPLRRVA